MLRLTHETLTKGNPRDCTISLGVRPSCARNTTELVFAVSIFQDSRTTRVGHRASFARGGGGGEGVAGGRGAAGRECYRDHIVCYIGALSEGPLVPLRLCVTTLHTKKKTTFFIGGRASVSSTDLDRVARGESQGLFLDTRKGNKWMR